MRTASVRSTLANGPVTLRTGWLFALVATLIYTTNTPVKRQTILAGLAPTTLVVARSLIGVALFGLLLLLTNVAQPQGEQRPFAPDQYSRSKSGQARRRLIQQGAQFARQCHRCEGF